MLVDRRGGYTYCVDVSPGSGTASDPLIALAGITGEGVQQTWGTVFDRPVERPTNSDVLVLAGDTGAAVEGVRSPVHSTYGTAGAGVRGVEVVLTGGTRVTATVKDGVWAAWWPDTLPGPTVDRLVVRTDTATRDVDPSTEQLPWDRRATRRNPGGTGG